MIENHEKSSLVRILFSLTDAECCFTKRPQPRCPLQLCAEMTKQERYWRLIDMELRELEDLYESHCLWLSENTTDRSFIDVRPHKQLLYR